MGTSAALGKGFLPRGEGHLPPAKINWADQLLWPNRADHPAPNTPWSLLTAMALSS